MSQDQAAAADKRELPEAKGAPQAEEELDDGKPMTFWEHLDELRKRIIWSLVALSIATLGAWNYHEEVMTFLARPFKAAWKQQGLPGEGMLHFGAPSVPFTVYVKLSMIAGALIASPVVFYQLWSFIAPGLYAKEKRFVIPFVLSSTALFIGGAAFGYYAAVPISLGFFLGLSGQAGGPQGVTIMPTVMMGEYVEYIGNFLLGFGVIFELPLLLLFLSIAGIVNYLHLIRFGRWFVLVAFIIAAILTPPDVTSQMVMAIPMCLLYVVSIGVTYVFGKPPSEAQRAAFKRAKAAEG